MNIIKTGEGFWSLIRQFLFQKKEHKDPNKIIDDGFIPADPEPGDWEFGSDLTVGAKSILPSGDWIPIFQQIGGELQRRANVETMSCVSFSATKILEAIIFVKYDIKLNISARFTAKMSGTTRHGNTFQKVCESLRKDGFVLEEDWPFDERMTWDEYHSPIPADVIKKGQASLNEWKIFHEWVDVSKNWDRLGETFTLAALQIAVYAWLQDNNSEYYRPDGYPYNHATIAGNKNKKAFDSYNPFVKQLRADYDVYRWAKLFDVQKIKSTDPGEKLYERFNGKLIILPYRNGEVYCINDDHIVKVKFDISDDKLFEKIHNVLKKEKAFTGLTNEDFELLHDHMKAMFGNEDIIKESKVVNDDKLLKSLWITI